MDNRDDAVRFAKEFLNTNIPLNDMMANPPNTPDEMEMERRVLAMQQSALDPDTNDFDVLTDLAAHFLRDIPKSILEGTPGMPVWLATFAADVLQGKRKRPTKRGPDKNSNWARDYKLYRAVDEVAKKFDFPKYSNNDLSTQTTAAEIVSLAAGLKVDVVINAYKKLKRLGYLL